MLRTNYTSSHDFDPVNSLGDIIANVPLEIRSSCHRLLHVNDSIAGFRNACLFSFKYSNSIEAERKN